MTFYDWIFSKYPEGSEINGAWGALHIVTLILIVETIVFIALLFRKRSEKCRRAVIITIASCILFFEIARRIIWSLDGGLEGFTTALRMLLPRPWCAISCWLMIVSAFAHKKFLYNIASTSGILCTLIFFAYPMVGFNNRYILFENLYSIMTHALLLLGCISLLTLRFTDFQHKTAWKEGICLAAIFGYAFLEIFLLKIEKDPLYFMPSNDVMEVLGISYPVYLVVYVLFLCAYFSAFYAVPYFIRKRKIK